MAEDIDAYPDELPDVLTVEEAAAALEVSVATVRRRCAQGDLPAEKVGKQWVVYRRAIEAHRPRRRDPRGAPSTALDLGQAFVHVRDGDLKDRDLGVPDLLLYRDQLSRREQVLVEAGQILSGALAPATGFELEQPKSAFFTRTALMLPIPERVAYQAAVASIAVRADATLPKGVFGGRIDPRPRSFVKPGVEQWLIWKAAVKAAIRSGYRWMIKTDVTAYFDNLKHSTLLSAIEAQNPEPGVLEAIKRMLRAWAIVPGQGIPQGPNASRFLQNLYFRPIDDEMTRGQWKYFRYMDDIRIVGRTRKEALAGIQVLERECKRRGLVLSAQKTRLLEGPKALADWEDSEIDHAQYLLDRGSHDEARKILRRLLRSAIAADGALERRRFKFSLWRIFKLRDREPLKTVLGRLEDLTAAAQLVAVYLKPWVSSELVERELGTFLNDPNRNTSPYMEAWLMALMLERNGQLPSIWVDYAREVARDRNRPIYVRGFAANVLARSRQSVDVDWIRTQIRAEYDPALLRAYAIALWRVGELDAASSARASSRASTVADCVAYLKRAGRVPSVLSGEDAAIPQ
jgi:excisionase family DNA binding protein